MQAGVQLKKMSSASMSRISGRQAMPARCPAAAGSNRAQRISRPRSLCVKASFNQGTAKKTEGAEVARTIVAAKTPFLKSGQVDLGAYEQLLGRMVRRAGRSPPIYACICCNHRSQNLNRFSFVDRQVDNGVEGVIVGGTTGEGQLMDWSEHLMLIAWASRNFGDKMKIVGNTGSNSTREAVHATEQGFAVSA